MRRDLTSWLVADDSAVTRQTRGRLGGVLFGAAALLAFAAVFFQPGWPNIDQASIYVIVLAVVLVGIGQWFAARHVPALAGYVALVAGLGVVALTQVLADPGTSAGQAVGLLYVWITVVTAIFCTRVATGLMLLLAGVAQSAALIAADVAIWVPQWVMTFGTCLIAAGLVHRLAARLRQQAATDPLTGAFNRRGLMDRLRHDTAVALRRGMPLTVALLDLDRFKELNDAHGHAAGDRALIAVSAAWAVCLREGDTLARLGGDEFFVILPGCDVVAARAIADRLLAETPEELACSVGLTSMRQGDAVEDILRRADEAMYEAKRAGGNRTAWR